MKNTLITHIKIKVLEKLLSNISPENCLPGCVVASISKDKPTNYWFNWSRDSAIVMLNVIKETKGEIRRKYIRDYLSFELQANSYYREATRAAAKVNVDAKPYSGTWGHCQLDGVALRYIVSYEMTEILSKEGFTEEASMWYSVISRKDLEFLIENWRKVCFDLWENTEGLHYFTLLSIREAFRLANLSDLVEKVNHELERFYQGEYIVSSIGIVNHIHREFLDSSTIYALVYFSNEIERFSKKSLITFWRLTKVFKKTYHINQRYYLPFIGRYEGDDYFGGGPWFICTIFMIQYLYLLSDNIDKLFLYIQEDEIVEMIKWLSRGRELSKEKIIKLADTWLDQMTALNDNFDYNEQIDRDNGKPVSVERLTWNYATILEALRIRKKITKL